MIPGPDQIVACPKCKGMGRYMTLVSGNTIGARIWTDGRQIAPMLPRPPVVVKCRHCTECYWLADAEEVGDVDLMDDEGKQVNSARDDVREVEEPTEEEYYEAIKNGLATDTTQERNLRVLTWWRRNDAFRNISRDKAQADSCVSAACRENFEALVHLLTEKDETDLLMKVEVLRELGQFASAKELLGHVDAHGVEAVVRQFRLLCEKRDTCVRELNFSPSED